MPGKRSLSRLQWNAFRDYSIGPTQHALATYARTAYHEPEDAVFHLRFQTGTTWDVRPAFLQRPVSHGTPFS